MDERAIDAGNDAFHAAFDARRDDAEGRGPILVALADDLVLARDEERTRFPFTPRAFHLAKGIAHVPVALWLLRRRPEPDRIASLREAAVAAGADLSPDLGALRPLLDATIAAIDAPSPDFAAALGAPLERAIALATKLQLAALHARTEEVCALLSRDERRLLRVAVTGDHQARVRSLGMQYFTRRLGADRVLYAEGIDDAERAIALVAADRLDRDLARAFFGDETRLQRDLLGDAAKAVLATFDLAPIDAP
ncbi:MAG: hypothetical protein KIT84_06105 [Labilithrix sp.]|nr:hypothetical protein [Labilithrix sp.]MCW5810564.1 hypothetical protein [Labilithrix sp.]